MLPANLSGKSQKIRRKGKSRYSSKEYSNPFFAKKKKSRVRSIRIRLNWKAKLFAIGTVVALALALWAVFYSGYFSIRVITISGGGRVEESSIEKLIKEQISGNFFVLLPQKNLWLFSAKRLRRSLEEKYAFNRLAINKKWPDELVISYDEKDYAMVWQEGGKYYYADAGGYMIEEADILDLGQKGYPVIENRSDKQIVSSQASVDAGLIGLGLELQNALAKYEADFKVEKIIIDNEINTIKVDLLDGPEIYFSTAEDMQKQIDKLLTVKREKISHDFANKIYIDVRYGNSVYYR